MKEIDNRGSHFWLTRYWAAELAAQDEDERLKGIFSKVSKLLQDSESQILKDFVDCQGMAVDIGGYYRVDVEKTDKAMNPSECFNSIIKGLANGQ